MQTPRVNPGDAGTAAWADNFRDDAYGGSVLRCHQQDTPGMTLRVENGAYYVNGIRYLFAGGSTPSFTAPTSHPRIDVVTIDTTGTLAIVQGTEASSPSVPAYPENVVTLCEVYNVVGETAIYTANSANYGWTSTQGYIQNDVRPNVSIGPSLGAISIDLIPDTTDTRNLGSDPGSSGKEWETVYAKNIVASTSVTQAGAPIAFAKFGGTGADGALSISSGTTTINLGGANIVIKNYTSINIASGATVNFSNPAAGGTFIILKSQGNVTISGTLDVSGMGSAGGVAGASGGGTGGAGTTPFGTFGVANNTTQYPFPFLWQNQNYKAVFLAPGAGGNGSSGTTSVAGAAGGNGGGSCLIECGGTYTATGTLKALGIQGGTGNTLGGSGTPSGGGGTGASGDIYVLYRLLGTDTATYSVGSVAGGVGGNGGTTFGGNGAAGGANAHNGSNAGAAGTNTQGGAGGAGAVGSAVREVNVTWA